MLNKPATGGQITNNLALLGLIVLLFFLNFYSKTLFFRPGSFHQWRQTDCLSITKNYYEEGMHFFEPKIHYQGPQGGRAVSECPILNYSVAALWNVFGEHEFIYRLLEYLIYLIAIFVLFNTIGMYLHSWLLAFFSVSLLLTSPLLTYYSLNFIADVPALSLGIICLCLFLQFYHNKRISTFYLSLFCGTLAVLLKASALMGLILLICFSLIDIFNLNRFFKTPPLFTRKIIPLICILASMILIILWYRFALEYNLYYTNTIFLLTLLPIWEMEQDQIIYNLKILCNTLFPLFLNKAMLFLFVLLVFYVIGQFKKLDTLLRYSFVLTFLYFIFYILFFFQVFGVHDYYLNNLMIFPVITLLCFAHIISKSLFIIENKIFVRSFLVCLLIFNSFHAAAIYRLRTIEDDKMVYWYPFISDEEKKFAKYNFWEYGLSIKKIENFTSLLRDHGIFRDEFVLSIPDQSFDISLYFLDQKGFTIAREHFVLDSTVTRHFKKRNVQYVVMSDTVLKSTAAFRILSKHLDSYFSSDGVEVFKVKPSFR